MMAEMNSKIGNSNYVEKIVDFLTTCVDIFFGMYKHRHFWTTYLPRLANVVCERPHLDWTSKSKLQKSNNILEP